MKSKKKKVRIRTEAQKADMRAAVKRVRDERVANGLCRYCNKPQLKGHNYCKYHTEYHSTRKRYKEKRDVLGRLRPKRGKGYYKAVWERLDAVLKNISLCDLMAMSENDISIAARCSHTTAHYARRAKLAELIGK